MAKARFDVYQTITDTLIEQLENGVNPWRKDWTGTASRGVPFPTRSTGQHYRGINILLLWVSALKAGYQSAHWFTYKQSQDAGGQVRKGEKSSLVVKYGEIEKQVDGQEQKIPYLKAYSVFNADQIDGLPEEFYRRPEPAQDLGTQSDEILDARFAAIGAKIETSDEPQVYFKPSDDLIHMPPVNTFHRQEGYFATLAHKLVHNAELWIMPRRSWERVAH